MIKNILISTLLLFTTSNLFAQMNVHFVDVGQGDATYIELPSGQNVLIDGGPSGTTIVNFLKSKGITKIDHVVLTHPHSDHYMGLLKVFSEFEVKNFYDTKMNNLKAAGDESLRELAKNEYGCKTQYPEVGEYLNWDSHVRVKVLNSCSEKMESKRSDEVNNCSIVLRLYYNQTGVLLTGDIEASIENAITRVFKSGLESHVLKVSHHGSKYSSSAKFLARVRPAVAVISSGLGNPHGHPHQEAIDRLLASGANLYSTENGTQTIEIPSDRKGEALVLVKENEVQSTIDIVFDGIFDAEDIGDNNEVLEKVGNAFSSENKY
jgi:competence protein ComEC